VGGRKRGREGGWRRDGWRDGGREGYIYGEGGERDVGSEVLLYDFFVFIRCFYRERCRE
jgi:hypothetical protein